jgi:sarcinarray family protein
MVNRILLKSCLVILLIICFVGTSSAYFSLDRYYNDDLCANQSIPKPLLKIGEPFTLRFDITAEQYCKVNVELSDLGVRNGVESFTIIEGPSNLGERFSKVYDADESFSYIWTLKATEEWSGGSMPIDFYYSVLLPGQSDTVVHSEFTAAYVTISDEYYDGPEHIPSSESQSNASSSNSTPGFTMLVASLALLGVILIKRMIR